MARGVGMMCRKAWKSNRAGSGNNLQRGLTDLRFFIPLFIFFKQHLCF